MLTFDEWLEKYGHQEYRKDIDEMVCLDPETEMPYRLWKQLIAPNKWIDYRNKVKC